LAHDAAVELGGGGREDEDIGFGERGLELASGEFVLVLRGWDDVGRVGDGGDDEVKADKRGSLCGEREGWGGGMEGGVRSGGLEIDLIWEMEGFGGTYV